MAAVLPVFAAPSLAACQANYTVKRGDTLSRIGQKWRVDWKEIAAANRIKSPWVIYTGQSLCIPSGSGSATSTPVTGVVPTFKITSVIRDSSVAIQTANFPTNTKFDVRMGAFGTAGVNGVYITTIDSGKGGSFSGSYTIPAGLQGSGKIAIRLESKSSGYFAYNWFYNQTAK